jgi:glucokinase
VSRVVIGVDLGGTNIKSAVINESGEVLHRLVRPTHAADGPARVLDQIAGCVKDLHDQVASDDIVAVGVGAPGPMNWETGVVYSPPNLPGWKDVPLADEIAGRTNLTAYVENDANAACWGEFWVGAGSNAKSLCCLTLGTGVGGGIVLDGALLHGPDGTAGELGHLCVQRSGRACGCGARGCLEAYASVTGLVCTAKDGLDKGKESSLQSSADNLTGLAISEAASSGDTFAKSVISETGEWVGVGVASLINLLNPDMIVICGGMIEAGDLLFDAIRHTATRQAFDVPAARAQIVPAALGQDAGVIGAAGCAWQRVKR